MTSPVALPNLRRFAGTRPSAAPAARCHVCAAAVIGDHRHLVEIDSRRLLCSCRACWLLFVDPHVAGGRLRAVPDRVMAVPAADVTEQRWEALQIPISLVFFHVSSATGRATAFYPGPGGATESQLTLEAWTDVVDTSPLLRTVVPDVEAVLVRGTANGRAWYIVPIDLCYELIGRIRTRWTGFSGGDGVGDEIDRFFAALNARKTPLPPAGASW